MEPDAPRSAFSLVFFDVDSTLVRLEGVDHLASGNPEVTALTTAAMNGEISVEDVYARRLELIRPSRDQIDALASEYLRSIVPDAREVIDSLRRSGADVHLVTGGIEQAILPLTEYFGLGKRALHAVKLHFDDDGQYADFDRLSPLTRSGGKEIVVRNVRARTHGMAAFIGDGVTDLETKPVVDLFIGFGGVTIRDRVRQMSDHYIDQYTLRPLLPLLIKDP